MMDLETLKLEWPSAGVALVTLNRPSRANAINMVMLDELDALCTHLKEQDPRAIVVTGAGKVFSSGFDLQAQAQNTPNGVGEWSEVLEADFKGIMSFWHMPCPVIAAVNGPALAGGFELMLACDLAVAAEDAVFGEPEMKFGAGIVAMLLPWFVSPKQAAGMIYLGNDQLTADQALDWGIINQIVPPERTLDAALSVARQISEYDPMVMKRTKQAMQRTYEIMGMPSALRAGLDIDKLIEGEGSVLKREFLEKVRTLGLRGALQWRNERAVAGHS